MAKRIVHKHTLVKCKQVRADQIEFGEIAIQAHEYGPYLQVKDRNGEVIRVGGVIFADHQPPCAQKGAWWVKVNKTVDPIEYTLYIYEGERWVPLIGGGEVSCCDVEWDDVLNKPECFEPCEHTHPPTPWPEIPEKPDCFEPCEHEHKWENITEKPDCFEPCEHTHPVPDWGEIPGKPDCFPACEHTHPPTPWPDIPEKPDCFPPCEHEHKWEQVTDKPCLYHCHDYIQHLDPLPA